MALIASGYRGGWAIRLAIIASSIGSSILVLSSEIIVVVIGQSLTYLDRMPAVIFPFTGLRPLLIDHSDKLYIHVQYGTYVRSAVYTGPTGCTQSTWVLTQDHCAYRGEPFDTLRGGGYGFSFSSN